MDKKYSVSYSISENYEINLKNSKVQELGVCDKGEDIQLQKKSMETKKKKQRFKETSSQVIHIG